MCETNVKHDEDVVRLTVDEANRTRRGYAVRWAGAPPGLGGKLRSQFYGGC